MYVRMYLRVITNGHKNEKGENYCTIWLKLYTFTRFSTVDETPWFRDFRPEEVSEREKNKRFRDT